jgi:hypothetical protein
LQLPAPEAFLYQHILRSFRAGGNCLQHGVGSLCSGYGRCHDLLGEDAKITFYGATIEQRMNGNLRRRSGAFIDQMAVLLKRRTGLERSGQAITTDLSNAARCGVFAKTDIQPLNMKVPILKIFRHPSSGGGEPDHQRLACGRRSAEMWRF